MLSSNQTRRRAPAATPTSNVAGIAHALCLAASPTFAFMAIVTMASGGADMICSAMQDTFPIDGMATMYLLMCAFHLTPWLRMIAGRIVEPERS